MGHHHKTLFQLIKEEASQKKDINSSSSQFMKIPTHHIRSHKHEHKEDEEEEDDDDGERGRDDADKNGFSAPLVEEKIIKKGDQYSRSAGWLKLGKKAKSIQYQHQNQPRKAEAEELLGGFANGRPCLKDGGEQCLEAAAELDTMELLRLHQACDKALGSGLSRDPQCDNCRDYSSTLNLPEPSLYNYYYYSYHYHYHYNSFGMQSIPVNMHLERPRGCRHFLDDPGNGIPCETSRCGLCLDHEDVGIKRFCFPGALTENAGLYFSSTPTLASGFRLEQVDTSEGGYTCGRRMFRDIT